MKNQAFFIVIAVVLISITAVWLVSPDKHTLTEETVNYTATADEPSWEIQELNSAPTPSQNLQEPETVETLSAKDSALFVASVYAAELTHPAYSQPLTEHDWDRLQPNYFNPQSIPVDDEGNELSASLSKYRFMYPEPIVASLSGEGVQSAKLVLMDMVSKTTLGETPFERTDGQWTARLKGKEDMPPQVQAVVKAEVRGKIIPIVLALKYLKSVATLEGFENAESQGADMVLPAKINALEKGLFRLRANLYDVHDKPVAHLVGKTRLDTGEGKLELKAHQSVLIGKEGPFHLKTFVLELMSPKPGVSTRYGHSQIDKFEIENFSVSSLATTAYEPSEQEKQRLKLLENMASGN